MDALKSNSFRQILADSPPAEGPLGLSGLPNPWQQAAHAGSRAGDFVNRNLLNHPELPKGYGGYQINGVRSDSIQGMLNPFPSMASAMMFPSLREAAFFQPPPGPAAGFGHNLSPHEQALLDRIRMLLIGR